MRHIIIIISFYFISFSSNGQTIWKDTLRTTVNLKKFKQSKKVVKAEYGKVIMYFNQKDYLKNEVKSDTVRITPKYFSEEAIVKLLKKGKVKMIRRSDNLIQTKLTHRLEQCVSTCSREFELSNGEVFFSKLEIIGLIGAIDWKNIDTSEQNIKPIQVKEFEYEEEFPNINDTMKIKIRDYFPLKLNTYYVYNNNNGYDELDTNVCKKKLLKNKEIFYFAECYNKYDIVSIGTTMFGKGIYYYQNDTLFTLEADYEKDINEKEIIDSKVFIPAYLKVGDSINLDLDGNNQTLTYLKKEDLQIGTILYKDCIKLKIIDSWPDTLYLEYVWLKKDIGLVKWMRATGRIDELVDRFQR
jgi:hypothetical protein